MRSISSDPASPGALTRRSILQLPWLCWLATLFTTESLAPTRLLASATARASGSALPRTRRTMSLSGTWSLTYGPCPDSPQTPQVTSPSPDWPTIPATVPGNVELDLVAAGRMEPLEKGNRVYEALKLESCQWWYRRAFQPGPATPGERAELVFDGLDCLATVWLNGALVGQAANMLIPHRFDVTAALLPDRPNELVVRIDPAVPAGMAATHSDFERSRTGHWESQRIRKAPHMYGWDIMPRVVSAGLWRGVRLEFIPPVHLSSVYWYSRSIDLKQKRAAIAVNWSLAGALDNGRYQLEVALSRNGRTVFHARTPAALPHGWQEIALDNADFWWPRGYGEQPLYDATVTLLDHDGAAVDRHVTRLGLRTIELVRSDIVTAEKPGSFGFVVNGVPIFAKGADWSALDALHSRDAGHLDRVFPLLVELNCNMVRCWGGNVYEEDRFFDLCDDAGILVWQDFAMACAAYPQDEAFFKAIAAEAEAVVPRLRNHPSLALWSGNNECDDALDWGEAWAPAAVPLPVDPNRDRITREVLPAVLQRLDPHRSYLPSSPYHSPAVFAAGNRMDLMPEVHLWGPRGYFKAPFYTGSPAHFISEIGYHGCPSRSSLDQMFDPDFVQPWVRGHEWNDQWLTKSVRFSPRDRSTTGRNDLMVKQIGAFFDAVPDHLEDFILASQITQAEAMKFFIEFWRRQKGPKQGIVWWNLRDGWPIVSDAVVDYYNTRKLAFHYIQRVQRDIQVICCEEARGQHSIVVVNDTLRRAQGRLQVRRAGDAANLLQASFDVDSNGKATLGVLPHPVQTEMWLLTWTTGAADSCASHYLAVSGKVNLAEYKAWMKWMGLPSV